MVLFSTQNLLQGLQRPRWPVVVSAWRQGLGLLLFGLLMKAWLGSPAGVWWAIAASVTTGALASAALAAWLADREGLVLWPPQIPPASPRQARP